MTAEIDMTLKIECQAHDVDKGKWEGSKQAQNITIHSFRSLKKRSCKQSVGICNMLSNTTKV